MLPAEAPGGRRHALLALRALAPGLAALALAGGCGGDEADGDGEPGPPATQVEVTLDADGPGGEPARVATLRCGVAGAIAESRETGRMVQKSDTRRACAAVAALPEGFADPVPPEVACTEIYGGPDEARIAGEVAGEPVDGTFTRANGCEIERFDRILPLLRALFPGYEPGVALRP